MSRWAATRTRRSFLHLASGMRMHVCHDDGEDRVPSAAMSIDGEDTFEELSARGMTFPLRLEVSKLDIRVRPGVSALGHYEPAG